MKIVLFIMYLVSSTTIFCQFMVKNETDEKVYMAVGYPQGNDWVAAGWYTAMPGQTITLLSTITNRYLYLHAYNSTTSWKGEGSFCVSSKAFTLKDQPGCQNRKSFRKIDTGGRRTYTTSLTMSAEARARKLSFSDKSCSNVNDLTHVTGVIGSKFLNIALPQELYRVHGLDVGNNTKIEFRVIRNGEVRVYPQSGSSTNGTIDIHIPVRVVNARADFYKNVLGFENRHHEDIKDFEVNLVSRIDFLLSNEGLATKINNSFTYGRRPRFYFMGFPISIGSYCRPHIQEVLNGMNSDWREASLPLLQGFMNNDCNWKDVASKVAKYLDRIPISSRTQQQLQNEVRRLIESQM